MANSRWIIGIACCATGIGNANGSSIPVTDLHGNNLVFANYLNESAPTSTIELFSSLQGKNLTDALESASPTRNSHSIYMAANSFFSASQLLTDHLQQQRIRHHAREGSPLSHLHRQDPTRLVADASEGVSAAASVSEAASVSDQANISAPENVSETASISDEANNASATDISEDANLSAKTSDPYEDDVPDASDISESEIEPCVDLGDYALWAEAIGDVTRQKRVQQAPMFYAGAGGFVAGVDYSQGENASFGSGIGYLYTGIRERQNGGHASVNQGVAFIYKELTRSNYYIDISFWGGYYSINNHRHILFENVNETAISDPHGWQCLPHLEAGGEFHWIRTVIKPFLMLDWANSWENRSGEHGAPDLNMTQKSHYSSMLRSEAGLRFYQKFTLSEGTLTFLERASYVNKVSFHTGSVPAFLIGSPGSFTVETLTKMQNLGLGQFEIIYDPTDKIRPKCAISYQGEFSSLYQSQQVVLTVEKTF